MVTKAKYGSWVTPITSDLIVQSSIRLLDVYTVGQQVYWLEMRPQEKGRYALSSPQQPDVIPGEVSTRTTVHEYGGAPIVFKDGNVIYFSNFTTQVVHEYNTETKETRAITSEGFRYADGVYDKKRDALIYVREDHTTGAKEPVNTIVSVDIKTGKDTVLASGYDFYSSPRLSPDGSQLAFVQWNHPSMPWDNTELFILNLNDLNQPSVKVAGDNEAIMCPVYSPESGTLYFITDRREGWWNIHRYVDNRVECVYALDCEIGGPAWTFGNSPYTFITDKEILIAYSEGLGKLGVLNTTNQTLKSIDASPFTSYDSLHVTADGKTLYFIGGSPSVPRSVVEHRLGTDTFTVLKKSIASETDSGYISVPETVQFPTYNNLVSYGYLYRPKNKDYEAASDEERPPLLVKVHGGPTAATSSAFRLDIQYWTSRGFAVFDVNYSGSTGYGREYRHRLYSGNWGVADIEDCCNGAQYLADTNVVDGNKLAIDGGSAGGYTVLAALTFKDTFKAGASHYGVSDLEALAHDTHKFEARYLDNLIGPYPAMKQVYYDRSPIHFTDRLNKPIALFQGDEDKIVPPQQSETMFKAVLEKNIPVTYLLFKGEQHGFRQAENIKKSLDGELYFYSRIFGFEAAQVEPIEIHNL
jgi:dipeptidyl aminopeptidase/acylaminoacyl peptidase